MLRLAVLVWIVLGTTLAGSFLIPVLALPELQAQAMRILPLAAAAGFVLAIPFAWLIARRIDAATRRRV